ncbi:MAG: hypothetical protein HQL56_03605 [Magnetococcales bacterium]|nr:hypothetical protein [Magnetococcales bacterium]
MTASTTFQRRAMGFLMLSAVLAGCSTTSETASGRFSRCVQETKPVHVKCRFPGDAEQCRIAARQFENCGRMRANVTVEARIEVLFLGLRDYIESGDMEGARRVGKRLNVLMMQAKLKKSPTGSDENDTIL